MNKQEFKEKYPKVIRVTKKNGRYFPEYYHKSFFGKWFSGWNRFQTDELWLNGNFTTLEKCDVSFATLEEAKKYFRYNKPTKEIIEI